MKYQFRKQSFFQDNAIKIY